MTEVISRRYPQAARPLEEIRAAMRAARTREELDALTSEAQRASASRTGAGALPPPAPQPSAPPDFHAQTTEQRVAAEEQAYARLGRAGPGSSSAAPLWGNPGAGAGRSTSQPGSVAHASRADLDIARGAGAVTGGIRPL